MPAHYMAASPTKFAEGADALTAAERHHEAFHAKRLGTPGVHARKELRLGRPLTPAERHELTVGSQVPAEEIQSAVELARRVGLSEAASPGAKALYKRVVKEAQEIADAEQQAAQAQQVAAVEEGNARVTAMWRAEKEEDIATAADLLHRPDPPAVRPVLRPLGFDAAVRDTSQQAPLFR